MPRHEQVVLTMNAVFMLILVAIIATASASFIIFPIIITIFFFRSIIITVFFFRFIIIS